jgi:transmembrane sensor
VIENHYTDILISKFLSGNAAAEEMEELEKWKASAEENRLLVEKSVLVWTKGDNYLDEQLFKQDKSELDAAYSRYLSNRIIGIKKRSVMYRWAAILVIPVALAVGWYLFGRYAPTFDAQFCEINAPRGHVAKAVLPDGTEVWINTGSSVIYNASAFNRDSREIQLKGEAYFEVTPGAEKPFTVVTPHAQVRVTGTAFNVNAGQASQLFEAVLATGEIELLLNTEDRKTLKVKPNQRVIFNAISKQVDVEQVEAEMFTSWRNGEIIFKDATLNNLIKELERIYDIRFHLQPENLGDLRFRGMFSYNNNLIEALEKIKKSSNVDYYIENKEVWLKKTN